MLWIFIPFSFASSEFFSLWSAPNWIQTKFSKYIFRLSFIGFPLAKAPIPSNIQNCWIFRNTRRPPCLLSVVLVCSNRLKSVVEHFSSMLHHLVCNVKILHRRTDTHVYWNCTDQLEATLQQTSSWLRHGFHCCDFILFFTFFFNFHSMTLFYFSEMCSCCRDHINKTAHNDLWLVPASPEAKTFCSPCLGCHSVGDVQTGVGWKNRENTCLKATPCLCCDRFHLGAAFVGGAPLKKDWLGAGFSRENQLQVISPPPASAPQVVSWLLLLIHGYFVIWRFSAAAIWGPPPAHISDARRRRRWLRMHQQKDSAASSVRPSACPGRLLSFALLLSSNPGLGKQAEWLPSDRAARSLNRSDVLRINNHSVVDLLHSLKLPN